MSEVGKWLAGIGLSQYAHAFEANDIDMDLLRQVDDRMLKDIGVSTTGHRLRIRNAIAKLASTSIVEANASSVVAATEAPAASAERRQLTVMFCDLVGSTALSTRLDPEDMREVILAYQAACSGSMPTYDGFVAKFMGDGILAYFGFPRAHEDDAERAVRAGLDIVAAVGRIRTRIGVKLEVRIGIATGLVVVGDLIGEGDRRSRQSLVTHPTLQPGSRGLLSRGPSSSPHRHAGCWETYLNSEALANTRSKDSPSRSRPGLSRAYRQPRAALMRLVPRA